MEKMKLNYVVLLLSVFSFSAYAEEEKGNKKELNLDKAMSLSFTCTPKEKFRSTILPSFSSSIFYNYDDIKIWYVNTVSEFIATEIKTDKSGVEVMKGEMTNYRGKKIHVRFIDNSHQPIYEIYTPKNEWNCISNENKVVKDN